MIINYYSKEVYGKTLYYLANASQKKDWYNLTGRKTITNGDMLNLATLTGVQFKRMFEGEV